MKIPSRYRFGTTRQKLHKRVHGATYEDNVNNYLRFLSEYDVRYCLLFSSYARPSRFTQDEWEDTKIEIFRYAIKEEYYNELGVYPELNTSIAEDYGILEGDLPKSVIALRFKSKCDREVGLFYVRPFIHKHTKRIRIVASNLDFLNSEEYIGLGYIEMRNVPFRELESTVGSVVFNSRGTTNTSRSLVSTTINNWKEELYGKSNVVHIPDWRELTTNEPINSTLIQVIGNSVQVRIPDQLSKSTSIWRSTFSVDIEKAAFPRKGIEQLFILRSLKLNRKPSKVTSKNASIHKRFDAIPITDFSHMDIMIMRLLVSEIQEYQKSYKQSRVFYDMVASYGSCGVGYSQIDIIDYGACYTIIIRTLSKKIEEFYNSIRLLEVDAGELYE